MQITSPPILNKQPALSNWLVELHSLLVNQPMSDLVPTSSSDVGTPGQLAYDSGFIYVCYDLNSWARIAYTDIVF